MLVSVVRVALAPAGYEAILSGGPSLVRVLALAFFTSRVSCDEAFVPGVPLECRAGSNRRSEYE